MRNFLATLFMLLLSLSSFSKTTIIQSLDISERFVACSIVDIDSDVGRLACWGRNQFPVFLDGSHQMAHRPILLPRFEAPVTQASTGQEHICVLLSTGVVQCWGNNQFGQLGLGHRTPAYAPISVSLPATATQISVSSSHSCALLTTGALYCWGNNQSGQLGLGYNGIENSPKLVPIANVTTVATGSNHTCVIQSGNVLCTGANNLLQLGVSGTPQSSTFIANGVTGVLKLDASISNVCAVLTNGTIKCWGPGPNGQLGHGASPASSTPVTVSGITTATDVASSNQASCARLSSGELYCWGSNVQLTLGSVGANTNIPRLVTGITNALSVESGDVEFCARTNANEVRCWGRGTQGLLGDGGSAQPRLNSNVDFSFSSTYRSFQSIALGPDYSFGIFADGISRSTGNNAQRVLGYGQTGPLAQASQTSFFADTILAPSSKIQLGYIHGCSTKVGGGIECWGRNYKGQAGNPTYADPTYTPYTVFASGEVLKLQTMYLANCALMINGTVKCWGNNSFGELGNGGFNTSEAIPALVPGITGAIDLNCGKFGQGCCATKSNNEKMCWGFNNAGQLGIEPTQTYEMAPILGTWGPDATQVTMGLYHTCYIGAQSKVFCFGGNFYGMLGDGSTINSTTPREVPLPGPAQEIKAGMYHTCALLQDSRLFCWGDNYYSEIGIGSEVEMVLKPAQVMQDVVQFDLGETFTCALDSSRLLWCWGQNLRGNFGNGNNILFPFPTPVNYKKKLK